MRDWSTLTPEERKAERDKVPGNFERKTLMDERVAATMELLKDDLLAKGKAWKIPYGCYLINTPEIIAAHCRAAAHGKN